MIGSLRPDSHNNLLSSAEKRLSRNNLIAIADDTGSCMNLHEPNITINEIRTNPKQTTAKSKDTKPTKDSATTKCHQKAHSKRDALGSSTAISTAVAGATSLLQSVINTEKPKQTTGSNYNVNLIKSESSAKNSEWMPSSVSEHGFKAKINRRYSGKEKGSETDEDIKLKLLKKL